MRTTTIEAARVIALVQDHLSDTANGQTDVCVATGRDGFFVPERGSLVMEVLVRGMGRFTVDIAKMLVEAEPVNLARFVTNETEMEQVRKDADVHRQTAAKMFNKHPADVTPQERRAAKDINFGRVFGADGTPVPFGEAPAMWRAPKK